MGFHMPISTYLQTTIPVQVIRVLDYLQIFSETLLVIVIFCEDFGVLQAHMVPRLERMFARADVQMRSFQIIRDIRLTI
jgi:hypothetical protein